MVLGGGYTFTAETQSAQRSDVGSQRSDDGVYPQIYGMGGIPDEFLPQKFINGIVAAALRAAATVRPRTGWNSRPGLTTNHFLAQTPRMRMNFSPRKIDEFIFPPT